MKAKIFVVLFLSVLSLTVMGQKKIALLEPRVGDGSSGVSGMEIQDSGGGIERVTVFPLGSFAKHRTKESACSIGTDYGINALWTLETYPRP